jgi:regulatory protein
VSSRRDPPKHSARDSALRALGRREHSAAQLKQKLEGRGYDEVAVEQVVGDLSERGWQSDARYAEVLIRSRVSQGYGRLYIEAELEVAKVPDAEISAAFAAAEVDWLQLAVTLHTRKFGAPPQTLEERHKQWRYLANRGFTPEQIRVALKGEGDRADPN